MNLVLVVNAGSSSLKYQLLNMDGETVIAKGNCDRIGVDGHLSHKVPATGYVLEQDCPFPTHTEAFEKLVEVLTTGEAKVIDSMSEISAVGHRIVQGAEIFDRACMVTEDVINQIDALSELAPRPPHTAMTALSFPSLHADYSLPQTQAPRMLRGAMQWQYHGISH